MKRAKAFILVELMIVVSIITILTGVVSTLWYTMEKMAKASTEKTAFSMRSSEVLDAVSQEIRRSIGVELINEHELRLQQLTRESERRTLRFFLQNNELIREIAYLDSASNPTTTHKMASLTPQAFSFTQPEERLIRIEFILPGKGEPLRREDQHLIGYAGILGGAR